MISPKNSYIKRAKEAHNTELRETTAFVQAAQLKSFSKAVKQLDYSQAAVTIQIKQLEQELNVHLFDRIGKQATLTHQGALFYEHAVSVMKELEHVRDTVTHVSELTRSPCLGTIESICATILSELLREYHRLYPKVNVKLITDSPETLLGMMNNNAINMVYFLDKRMYDSKWIKVLGGPEDIVFVTASDHPLVGRDSLDPDLVMDQPFILTRRDASYRFILDQYLAVQGKEIHPFLEIGNTELIISLPKKNLGVSFLPEFTIHQDIINGELAVLDVRDSYMRTWRQIAYHKDKWVTREMDAFPRLAAQ